MFLAVSILTTKEDIMSCKSFLGITTYSIAGATFVAARSRFSPFPILKESFFEL